MRIALVGGIGCGKSTVLKYLSDKNQTTFSCDACQRDIMRSVESHDLLYQLETIDLGIHYNHDPRPYADMYMHMILMANPSISIKYNNWLNDKLSDHIKLSDAMFFEIPIVFEIDYAIFDQIWVVKCAPTTQYERLLERYNGDSAYVQSMILAHLPFQNCLTKVDLWIDTDQPASEVQAVIDQELGKLNVLSQ